MIERSNKPLVWLQAEIKSPPLSPSARIEAGFLLRCLQLGKKLSLPHSRPMPAIAQHCHELRVNDEDATWRIIYRIDDDAIVIVDVFSKKTAQVPQPVIDRCRRRLKEYDHA